MFPTPYGLFIKELWAKFCIMELKKIRTALLDTKDYNKQVFLPQRRKGHEILLRRHLQGDTEIRSSDPHLLPDQLEGPAQATQHFPAARPGPLTGGEGDWRRSSSKSLSNPTFFTPPNSESYQPSSTTTNHFIATNQDPKMVKSQSSSERGRAVNQVPSSPLN